MFKTMVGNTGTLMTMRIVRSKLRKREESSTTAVDSVTVEAQQAHGYQSRSALTNKQDQQILTTCATSGGSINNSMELGSITFARKSGSCGTAANGWVFPPNAPSPNLYNCNNHESIIDSSDRNGFKGFRKQFSGRFKRLVSKKQSTSSIPPELKPQLKTIYVY